MYNVQELATAARYGINAVVIVFNDNAFGNVLRDQRTRFNGRAYGSELSTPDFMKLADAFGVRGVRVAEADAPASGPAGGLGNRGADPDRGAGRPPALPVLAGLRGLWGQFDEWVRALADTGDLYRPLAWPPAHAYRFLQSVPELEQSGLSVRVP